MTPIEFWVSGEPKGQPRPKAFSRGGFTRVYDPGTAEGWKGCVALAARQYLPKEPLACPVSLRLSFKMPRPKGHYRANGTLKDSAPRCFSKKPDADNLAKAVMDALTQLRVWLDDCQVVRLDVHKTYAIKTPGVSIEIQEVTQ